MKCRGIAQVGMYAVSYEFDSITAHFLISQLDFSPNQTVENTKELSKEEFLYFLYGVKHKYLITQGKREEVLLDLNQCYDKLLKDSDSITLVFDRTEYILEKNIVFKDPTVIYKDFNKDNLFTDNDLKALYAMISHLTDDYTNNIVYDARCDLEKKIGKMIYNKAKENIDYDAYGDTVSFTDDERLVDHLNLKAILKNAIMEYL